MFSTDVSVVWTEVEETGQRIASVPPPDPQVLQREDSRKRRSTRTLRLLQCSCITQIGDVTLCAAFILI